MSKCVGSVAHAFVDISATMVILFVFSAPVSRRGYSRAGVRSGKPRRNSHRWPEEFSLHWRPVTLKCPTFSQINTHKRMPRYTAHTCPFFFFFLNKDLRWGASKAPSVVRMLPRESRPSLRHLPAPLLIILNNPTHTHTHTGTCYQTLLRGHP